MRPNANKKQSNHIFFESKRRDAPKIDDDYEEMYETPKRWFEEVAEDPVVIERPTEQQIIELKEEAKKCNDTETANHNIKNSKTNSKYKFIQTIMSKGTVADKISAYTVAIQDNPVASLETIRNLVGMVKAGNKECSQVIDTLAELFLTSLLHANRRLKLFHQRPLTQIADLSSGNAITRRRILSNWYFEDQLKEIYTGFVRSLNSVAHDTVDSNKEKAIGAMFKLLAGNPEQEKNLLTFIVNKLGDPSQQVASKAIYCLSQLLAKHSNMQEVVLNEVEKLLFRANVSTKAQYYGLCFLSQFYLSHEAPEVAQRLIEVYFSFFKACIKKGEVDSRMMSSLLMGVNRAYPYAKLELEKISGHIDTIYRVVHIANFNIGLHALTLLYQVSDFTSNINDRFYCALYKKLADPKIFTTTHHAMLLNLLYKALIKDTELSRVRVFVKRLLQLVFFVQPAFACGLLYLISQVIQRKEGVQALVLKQVTVNYKFDDDDDNAEEHYKDVKEDETDSTSVVEKVELKEKPGWYHCEISKTHNPPNSFKPLSRNPLYAGGENCAFTELERLKHHFHPTVALYASKIVEGLPVQYSGDPLKDFTLIRFLDRFVFKNPKRVEEEGEKQGAHPIFGKRKAYKPRGVRLMAVRSASYLKEKSKNIPVDELFMHTYLQRKYKDVDAKEVNSDDDDLESVQSEEFEDMLDRMGGLPKDDDEEFDFMQDIGGKLNILDKNAKNKKQKDKNESDDDDDDDDNEDDLSEDEELSGEDELLGEEVDDDDDFDINNEDQDLFADLDDDEQEDLDFGDDDDMGNNKKGKKNGKKSKKDKEGSIFASADEFAQMLDDEGSSKVKPGGSQAFSNRDNAKEKQLAWEDKRNRWLSGYNNAIGKGKKSKSNHFNKKRPNENKIGGKPKKFKK